MLRQETEQSTGSNGRTDNASDVRAHSVHQQEVVAVVLQTEVVGDACSHWYSTHAGIADERVQLLAFRQEEIHQFDEADT